MPTMRFVARYAPRSPVARKFETSARQIADHEARGKRPPRFDVLGVDADVADVRVGERDDLARVRRIGQDLLVAGHRRVEDDLADREPGRADRHAAEHRAVGEREDRAGAIARDRQQPGVRRGGIRIGHVG